MPRFILMLTVDAAAMDDAMRAALYVTTRDVVIRSVSVYEEEDTDHAQGQAE